MINSQLQMDVQASDLTKFDNVHLKTEGVLSSTKVVTDANFGTLGAVETVVPTTQTLEANGYTAVDTLKSSNTPLSIDGFVQVLSTSRIKVGA